MPHKPRRSYRLILLLVACIITLVPSGRLHGRTSTSETDSIPILRLVNSDGDAPGFVAATDEMTCCEPNLVIVTHGWYEKRDWPGRMATAIAKRVDRQQWQCGWYDWKVEARHLRPSDSARIGRDTTGPRLGEKIVGLSQNWRHVHLIGHSAGAWVINAAAEVVADRTEASIHITFLDAYVPDGWDEEALGKLIRKHPGRCWADHYFTRDWLNLTENVLTGVRNVDVTAINPGIRGHLFPWHWYLATIAGRYTTDERFANTPVFCQADGVTYGFPRTLEAGPRQWKTSLTLKTANSPIRIHSQRQAPP